MSKKKATATCLPMSRTARIMNSAIGVDCVNQDMIALATKATEIFIQDLTRKAYELSDDDSNVITYDDIQRLVHAEPQYDFLVEWIPKRMKFSEALARYEETRARMQQKSDEQTQSNMISRDDEKDPNCNEANLTNGRGPDDGEDDHNKEE